MSVLSLRHVAFAYGEHTVLQPISLELQAGQFACLLGPSGSGKTTLLRLIAGLESWQAGTIALGGHVLSGPHDDVPPEKRGVGMVFQQPTLFPTMTVAQNVGFGLRSVPSAVAHKRVNELLAHVGLAEKSHLYPHQLSGGQQHRVALARALAPEVKLLLLDEPFSHLDPALRLQISHDTRTLARMAGVTCLMVTHDATEAMRLSDHLFLLDASGRLHQSGSPRDIYHHPVDAYAALALGEMNLLPASSDGTNIVSALGTVAATHPVGSYKLGVRPHDVVVGTEGVSGKIMQMVCMGAEDHINVRLEDDDVVVALPSTHRYRLGDTVRLAVREGAACIFK